MNKLVNRKSTSDGRTNLRPMLEIESEFYALTGDYTRARKVYEIIGVFDAEETAAALKKLDLAEGYSKSNARRDR